MRQRKAVWSWSFYGSLNNEDWSPVTTPATIIYSVEDGRTLVTVEFSSAVENLRYVKAVVTSTAGVSTAFITEIDVNQTGDTGTGRQLFDHADPHSFEPGQHQFQTMGSVEFGLYLQPQRHRFRQSRTIACSSIRHSTAPSISTGTLPWP